ncbi:LOW QUALITY PROTEIN: interferon-induced protein with tetratricopeptide repeats 5-like [Discoglossus pictus]
MVGSSQHYMKESHTQHGGNCMVFRVTGTPYIPREPVCLPNLLRCPQLMLGQHHFLIHLLLLLNTESGKGQTKTAKHRNRTVLPTENKYMVHNMLGYIKHLKGDYPKAISQLEKAEEIISEANSESSKKYLVTYAKDNIKLSEIYGEQRWALLRFGPQYYEMAIGCFEKALETEKEDPEWNSGYATVVYRLEGLTRRKCSADKCKSLSLLKCAVQLNPDSVVKALLGLKLQELKQSKEAKMYIEEALDQTPQLPYLLRYVATFYRKEGMIDEALHVLKIVEKQIPTSGLIHHQIVLCYRKN